METTKIYFAFLAVFFVFCGFQFANAAGNVGGYAWSENIGWISFNCANSNTCATSNYGVNMDLNNGKFSGYAWSENVGWISFNESDEKVGVPPLNDPCGDSSCIAKATPPGQLGRNNVNINGWSRALSQGDGWDGWFRFDHNKTNKVYVDTSGDFHGYAWGHAVVGWLSFNCDNGSVCATSNYKVYIIGGLQKSPEVKNMLDPDDAESYCNIAPGKGLINFQWTYTDADSDTEKKFEFKVNDINNPEDGNPEVNRTVSGLSNPSGSVNTQSLTIDDNLPYGKLYYWWVRVWDSTNRDSGWVAGPTFDTPLHAYPWPDFTYLPAEPSVNETVNFTDTTLTYGGASIVSRNWTFQDGDPATSTAQNPGSQFLSKGDKAVSLAATDNSGYGCTGSKNVSIQTTLPDWREVPPASYLFKALASLASKIYFLKAKVF
ncbi:MAG: PKD domain-containing protein [bacterium]|nr:PKD domain-containing protein [bacterium]